VSEQLTLFGYSSEHAATWSPRDLWLKLSGLNVDQFAEDHRLERKPGHHLHFENLAEYLSMWSNTVDGGILLIGMEDNGKVGGCAGISSDKLNRLYSFHTQLCPEAAPEPKRIAVTIDEQPDFVIAIYVPYRGFLVETNKGEAFIRRGDSKHKMSAEEKDDFRSTRHERSWEQRPNGLYKYPHDFEAKILEEFCTNFREREGKHQWTNEEVLIDRHLLIEDSGKLVPLNCIVLFAAKDPRAHNPGCRIRVQRFEGTEEGQGSTFKPLRDFYIEGNIPTLIEQSSQRIADLNYNVTWLNREGKFVTTPEYPRWAWFEAIVNALVHRSYSFSGSEVTVKFFADRLEIESPGSFVPPVNVTNVYYQRASRNPHLMEAMRYLGFVHMTREGTRRMREDMARYNLPEPTFSQETLHGVSVRVTLRNDHQTRKRATDRDVATFCGVDIWKQLQPHEVQIVGFAFNNGSIQVAEAERLTGRRWATSKKDLDRLVKKGLLVFEPPKKVRDPKAHYRINEDREAPNDIS
jgi:ATP-dependent DNA helicase RecG